MAVDLGAYLPWRISGTYLEACNCEAICPCRRIGGRQLRTVLANRYDDDEEGSPWSFVLYVDERARA